jgi:hypothetical protein
MKLELEPEKHEEFQQALIREIAQTVMVKLVEAGLKGEKLEQATANVSFSIASIIDDTTAIEKDGEAVKPYLTFRDGDDAIIHCGENAFTYEFVTGILKDMFDR